MTKGIVPFSHRFIERVRKFVRGPYALLAAVGLALVLGGLGLYERDARMRRAFELRQLQAETAARIKELEGRVTEAVHAANRRNAQVIEELEASRKKLAMEGARLRERLAALEREERVRVEQVHALSPNLLAKHIADRLGPGVLEAGNSGLGLRDSGPDHPVTQTTTASPESLAPNRDTRAAEATRTLDTAAMRKVETAFVELESCREQQAVKDEEVANCGEQLAASDAVAANLKDSVRQLNQALRLKDEILERREALRRAELEAARPSRWVRIRRAVTYIAVGALVGVVAR